VTASGTDFYLLDERLTDEERAIRDRLRAFCDHEVVPIINGYWERAEFPFELVPKIAGLGLAGGVIEGYGCPGMSATAAGLVSMEWARADGSIGTFFGVHSNLAMQSIHLLGSEEQRERWLRPMAALEAIGAFGLTEPEHGSDAVALETSARRDGDGYVLHGRKKWIGNASFADVTIIWARGEDGHVGGYLVEKKTPGFHTTVITGKTSLRAVWQAEIELDDVRVDAANRLPGCRSFRDVARVLTLTRYTVAWRALGVALAAYEAALRYAGERHQFGRPLSSYQLVQDKLSRMLGEITAMQLLCLRLSELAADERLTAGMASLAKMNHASKARAIVADARDILGGNGILLEHHVARHHADMEAVFTFEGTDSIQSLIVGREITGENAIAPPRV
jgi:glutaryl-CoA dehydrogenase